MKKSTLLTINSCVLFLIGWVLLIPNVAPSITAGDAAELALAGTTLGIPHPPGYPIFALLNNLLERFLYFGNAAYRQNLLSLFFSVATIVLLGLFLYRLTGKMTSMYLALLTLLVPIFRAQSTVTEVFPLAVFWGVMLLLTALWFIEDLRWPYLLAFFIGLGLNVHTSIVLFVPSLLFLLWGARAKRSIKRYLPICSLLFVLGFSISFYLIFRSLSEPYLDWEDPQNLRRFWGVITRERYGFFQLAQGESNLSFSYSSMAAAVTFFINQFLKNFGYVGLALLLIGTLASTASRNTRRLMMVCWIQIIFSGPFFLWLAHVDRMGASSQILDRFLTLPLLFCALIMTMGPGLMWTSRVITYRVVIVGLASLMAISGIKRWPHILSAPRIEDFHIQSKELAQTFRWDTALRDAGLCGLRHLPLGSLLFSDRADEMEFVLAYLLGAERRRPDVQFVDCNAGVTKSIYGVDYYRIWGPRRIQRRLEVEREIVANKTFPVFYATVDPTMVNIYRTPCGFLYQAPRLSLKPEMFKCPSPLIFYWRSISREDRGRLFIQSLANLMGNYLFEKGEYSAASDQFGVAQRSGGPSRYLETGYLFQRRRLIELAGVAYRGAFKAGVTDPTLFANYGLLEAQNGNHAHALEILHKGLKYHPQFIPLNYNLATVYWDQKRWDDAAFYFGQVLMIDSEHEDANRFMKMAKNRAVATKTENNEFEKTN